MELYSVCDGVKDCFFGGDEGTKPCTERFCTKTLGGRWKCPNEAKCIFHFQVGMVIFRISMLDYVICSPILLIIYNLNTLLGLRLP